MKVIIGILLFILIGSFVAFLLPLAIGGFVAWFMFSDGNIVGGIIALVIGLICGIFYCRYMFSDDHGSYFSGSSGGYEDEECPYCGSGDTDGNHCHTCNDNF